MENQDKTSKVRKENKGRREFIGAAAAALFAGVVITITGCNEDDKVVGGGNGGGATGDFYGDIANNHGHSAKVTKAQIATGGAITLSIMGTAYHDHTITITADQMALLKAGTEIHTGLVSTIGDSHTHSVMLMKA